MNPIPMQPNLPEATTALGTVVKPKQWGMCPHCEKLSPMHEREWVGLTNEEMQSYGNDLLSPHKSIRDVFNSIEAKLKEKNT